MIERVKRKEKFEGEECVELTGEKPTPTTIGGCKVSSSNGSNPVLQNGKLSVPEVSPIQRYQVYPERWWVLVAVFLLNISNYAHWVAFPAVNKTAAMFYDQPGHRMDFIPTLSYGLGVPCSLLATYVVERFGLKYGLQIGGSLTGLGGLMCFLSSFPPVSQELSSEVKFYLALVGQAITGIACPFIACVPTKVSQHWFADEQRAMATTILGMSGSVGCILGQGLTPLMVLDTSGIMVMNTVWFIPAAIGSLLTMFKVHSNYPPLPPSPSASIVPKSQSLRQWLHNIKCLLTNKAFVIIFVFLGGCMGCVSSLTTKMEQILCARGYTDQLAGLAGSLILACGTLSAIPIGMLGYKTGRMSLLCKTSIALGMSGTVGCAYFMRYPYNGAAIIASCVVLGALGVGAYAVGLELIVECTYPIDQATSTALLLLSSALQGVVLMGLENVLNGPLDPEAMTIQTCNVQGDLLKHQQAKDYSSYLNFLAVYCCTLTLVFVVFFKTDLKRTNADKLTEKTSLTCRKLTNVKGRSSNDAEAATAFKQTG